MGRLCDEAEEWRRSCFVTTGIVNRLRHGMLCVQIPQDVLNRTFVKAIM